MSWTVNRSIAQFGLHTASSVAVRAEQGRWDDTQKKYLSNLSKQTRQRTELSHRAALPVMCYWKNAGGMKLWAQRDGHSIVKNVTLPFDAVRIPFFFFFFFENLLWLTGSKNVKTLRIILWIPVPKAGFLPVFLFFSPRFSRCQREPGSLVLRVSAKMFIPLNSWLRMFCLLSPSLIQSVCRESNGLTVRREKGCHGSESRLFAHVQTSRMDEDTDGFSLRWTFLLSRPVCGWRHGNPG